MTNLLRNPVLHVAVHILCLCVAAATLVISAAVYHAHMGALLFFLFFIVFYAQLPGQLLLRALQVFPKHLSTVLCLGFFSGWAFLIFQYFLAELIHTDILLYAVGPVLSLLYIRLLLKEGGAIKGRFHFSRLPSSLSVFLTLSLLVAIILTQFLYLDPMYDERIYMNPDKGFHLGLINSLSHGFPLENLWFSGVYYNYHVFTETLFSIPVRLFGITSDVLLFTCGPWMTVYAFGVSLYSAFRELMKRKDRAGLYCLVFLLSNIFIARAINKSIALLFFLRNENVAGYGASAALAVIIACKYWNDQRRQGGSSWRPLILIAALIMLATGIKGPFGLVLLGGLWGTYLLGVILRKESFRPLLGLCLISIGFFLVYTVVLGSKGQGDGTELPVALGAIARIGFYKSSVITLTKSLGIPLLGRYLILIFIFTVFMLTAFFLPFVIGYARELFLVFTGRREYDFARILVYAVALIGFIAMMLLKFHGSSQIYFGFATIIVVPLISFWFFEDMEENRGLPMNVLRGVFVGTLILTSLAFFSQFPNRIDAALDASNPASTADRYQSISHDEYLAMRWIDKNTPRDSLLATDRYYSCSLDQYDPENRWTNRFFLYSVYSNRMCYLSGSGYTLPAKRWKERVERIQINNRLFDAGDAGRGELARKLGIDYVVLSKDYTKAGSLENEDYQLCYSNPDVDIYKIKP